MPTPDHDYDDGGGAKLLLTHVALTARRDHPEWFTTYRPVEALGDAAGHVLAFDRGAAITVATRLPVAQQHDDPPAGGRHPDQAAQEGGPNRPGLKPRTRSDRLRCPVGSTLLRGPRDYRPDPLLWQQSYEAEDAVYTGGGYSRNGPEGSPADVSPRRADCPRSSPADDSR